MASKTLSILFGAAVLSQHAGVASAHPFDRRESKNTFALRELPASGSGSTLIGRQGSTGNQALGEGRRGHYFAQLTIGSGSSSQQANVLIDTGSQDLVLNPAKVPSGDPSIVASSTSCSERYGGRASQTGSMASGPYSIFGFQGSGNFCEVALPSGIDGVLGLGFVRPPGGPGVSSQTRQTPLGQLAAVGLNSFGIYLSDASGGGGAFTPNGYDSSFFDTGAQFVTEAIDGSTGFWKFGIQSTFTQKGSSFDLGKESAFVDTGTPTILVPQSAASQIWSLVGADASGSYGSNCNPGGDPITFTSAAGNTFDLPANVYVIPSPAGDGTCINAFQPMAEENMPMVTLGAPFVRAFYTYFDVANNQLQFAKSGG